jgi:hypothetical protein
MEAQKPSRRICTYVRGSSRRDRRHAVAKQTSWCDAAEKTSVIPWLISGFLLSAILYGVFTTSFVNRLEEYALEIAVVLSSLGLFALYQALYAAGAEDWI